MERKKILIKPHKHIRQKNIVENKIQTKLRKISHHHNHSLQRFLSKPHKIHKEKQNRRTSKEIQDGKRTARRVDRHTSCPFPKEETLN